MKAFTCLRIPLSILLLSACSLNVQAQFVIGRYASEFLSLGAGARALAMGNAASAAPTASSAGYYNPSALAINGKHSAEFMHAAQFDNAFTYDYLSFVKPSAQGIACGLTIAYTHVGSIPQTALTDPSRPLDDNNRVIISKMTGDHELALIGSGARIFGNQWRLGANTKVFFKSVAGKSAYGLGFDVGAGRTINRHIEVGAMVRDVTTSVLAWTTGRTESILPSFALGGLWTTTLPSLSAKVSLAADAEGHFETRGEAETVSAGPLTVEPHVGLEYLISDVVALRGGLSGKELTAGAGLRFSWLSVAAAFQNHADLGLTNRVSVAATW